MIGNYTNGVISIGVKTPIIKPKDNIQEIVISSILSAFESLNGKFDDGDIIAITEAVCAIAQANFVTFEDIRTDIERKFENPEELVLVNPIQSRNRFMDVLKAIAGTKSLKRLVIALTYPTDEVGNRFVSNIEVMKSGVNPYTDWLTPEEFYEKFGEPKHPATGRNYIKDYITAAKEYCSDVKILLGNDFSKLKEYKNFLICTIHDREGTRLALEGIDADHIYDLSEIMDESINGSGFNEDYGLYGTNKMYGETLKLLPRNCQELVDSIQEYVLKEYGKTVEVLIFGDGAYMDPNIKVWELADSAAALAITSGLKGMPVEVKLKLIATEHPNASPEELEEIIKKELQKRMQTTDITAESSTGTTPREKKNLVASLCDLMASSGHRATPVVYISNYLIDYFKNLLNSPGN